MKDGTFKHTAAAYLKNDGNIEFLGGKHAVLFVLSFLIFLSLSVPYIYSYIT